MSLVSICLNPIKSYANILRERSKKMKVDTEEWIPITDEMPGDGSWAIWCSVGGLIQVARWKTDAIDHFYPGGDLFELEDAVAWMPLPKPSIYSIRYGDWFAPDAIHFEF